MAPGSRPQADREQAAGADESGQDTLRIMVMIGSPRRRSYTRALGNAIVAGVERFGATALVWDAARSPLPTADPSFHGDARRNPDPQVAALVAEADSADAFVLLSPIYHNSYSAALKNALDNLGIAQFHYKPVAICSHGNRATHAVDHLRIVARGLLAVGLPTQICTIEDDYRQLPDGTYEIGSPDIGARVERLSVELVAFARSAALLRAAARR